MAGTLNEDMICPFLAGGFVARYGDEITFTFESTVKCMCSRCMLWDNVRDWCSLKTQRNIDKKK